MAPLGIFKRRKKETEKIVEKKVEEKTLLEELCKGDSEIYNVLKVTMLLNPEITKQDGEIDARIEKAQKYEKNKDYVKARIEYNAAGGLALFEGKIALVQKLFQKAAEVDSTNPDRSILEYFAKKENAEKAIVIAQEYYRHMAKPTKQ
jgi:hypothetical protein